MSALRFARQHPFDCSLTTRFKAVHVLDFLQPRPGENLLDVGCGLGYFLNRLARGGVRGWGMDYSHKSLALARRLCSAHFAQGDAQVLPYRDNSFDQIIFTDVIEHVADDRAALRELVRVARPGARLALVTPGVRGALARTRWRRLFHDEEGTPEYDQRAGYTPEELRRLLEEAGVRVQAQRQTLIFLGEFFLQLTKWYLARKKVHYQTQGDLLEITDTWAYRLYRRVLFPVFWGIGRVEELLVGRWCDGHSLIVLGVVDKPVAVPERRGMALEASR
ncbi:MAG: methyltransferase domain-containing protein [Candidatus Latescibacteria bacterium]|nr:methyltransferase domain-containing protein [Candidatus Latescibacterota bacterium]